MNTTNGQNGLSSVVNLSDRMRAAPMQVPHSAPPRTKYRGTTEPAEVVELRAPWQATDRLLGLHQTSTADRMRALMTIMGPDEAREALMRSVLNGILDALKSEIKGCGND